MMFLMEAWKLDVLVCVAMHIEWCS